MTPSPRPLDDSSMVQWALWYASLGWYIMPLHQPIFDDTGAVCGCTCEAWKREKRDPEYVCPTPGKHPIHGEWEEKSTTDPDQIRRWWHTWPSANIGLAVGKSGLLTLDLDAYKDNFASADLLTRAEEETITQLSGGGGAHLLYAMPEGKAWGNHRGEMPAGIDVRGVGGMQVIAPSMHPSGARYAWELDYGPDEISAARVPEHLTAILDDAVAKAKPSKAIHFDQVTTGRPDLAAWKLPGSIVDAINATPAKGGRSEHDMRVVVALCYAGLTDDQILAVFQHFPIGTGKYAEGGARYLATTIGNARTFVEAHPHSFPDDDRRASLLEFDATDNGNAESFKAIHGADFLHVGSHGWLMWNGAHWTDELSDAAIELRITDVLKERRKAAVDAEREAIVKAAITSNAKIKAAKERLTAHLATTIDTFDQDPDLLNCLNGVINLKTGSLTPHDRQRFTYCVGTYYDPNAKSTEWTAFLESTIPDREVRTYLQTALGYTLTGHNREECLFFLFGPTRSGKSTLAETLLTLLGRPVATTTDFGTFTAERNVDSQNFALAPLKAARLVVASESGAGEYLNVGKIKQMTGGDFVTAAHKHRDSFTFRPQWKIWLLSNHGPKGDVDDDALWAARLRVIEFPNSFLGQEDKALKWRLRQPENMAGILTWLVQGARRWYSEGLHVPEAVTKATARHRDDLDWIGQWLAECCAQDGGWTANHLLYQSYENWCNENGVKPKGARAWGKALSSKGLGVGMVKKLEGKTWRGVNGLTLLE
jgi:putative DNA primase/helicase